MRESRRQGGSSPSGDLLYRPSGAIMVETEAMSTTYPFFRLGALLDGVLVCLDSKAVLQSTRATPFDVSRCLRSRF